MNKFILAGMRLLSLFLFVLPIGLGLYYLGLVNTGLLILLIFVIDPLLMVIIISLFQIIIPNLKKSGIFAGVLDALLLFVFALVIKNLTSFWGIGVLLFICNQTLRILRDPADRHEQYQLLAFVIVSILLLIPIYWIFLM